MSLKFKWFKLALTLFILTILVQVTFRIKCYICDGRKPETNGCVNKEKWELIDYSKEEECFRQETTTQKGLILVLGVVLKNQDPELKCTKTTGKDGKVVYCFCNTDGCNSGGKVSVSSIIFGISILFIWIEF